MTDAIRARPFLTVQEAAVRLRISRTGAYMLARRWLETAGQEDIPAVRIGRSIRVPASAFDQWTRGMPFQTDRSPS
jgi:excisionase family DNA binding protein